MHPNNSPVSTKSALLRACFILVLCAGAGLLTFPHHAFAGLALQKPPNNLGLVGYWPFDEDTSTKAGDFSGNGNTGTLTGSPVPSWTSGRHHGALSFDGSQNYVNLPSSSALRNDDCTVAAWVKSTSDIDGTLYAAAQFAGNTHVWDIELGPSSVDFANELITISYRNNGSGDVNVAYETTNRNELFDGNWHQVVVTEDTATHIYLDGVSKTISVSGTDNGLCTGDATLDTFRIGNLGFNSGNINYFNGKIDEVRIYNRALSASEVPKLYQSGAVKVNASSADLDNGSSLEKGLVGLWTFDGKDMTTPPSVSDDFNRGPASDLGANWISNSAVNTISAGNYAISNDYAAWAGSGSFSSDQYAQTEVASDPTGGGYYCAAVRVVVGSSGYSGCVNYSGGSFHVGVYDQPNNSQLGETVDATSWTIGDTIRTEVQGTTIRVYHNGVLTYSFTDPSDLYEFGRPGLGGGGGSEDNFQGGSLNGASAAHDLSGSGNDGELVHYPAPTIGKLGQGLFFDHANSQYIESLNANVVPTGGASYSVAFWEKTKQTTDNDGGEYNFIQQGFYTGNAFSIAKDGFGSFHCDGLSTGATVDDQEWHHIVCTYDASSNTRTAYVDGSSVASDHPAGTIDPTDSSCPFTIGGGTCTFTQRTFDGKMDDVRVYNRALSAKEVHQLYKLGTVRIRTNQQ